MTNDGLCIQEKSYSMVKDVDIVVVVAYDFLRRSVANIANITKGFMHILKKDTMFIWDDRS
jgi:hypothetical protein